jgi:LuxR family maltose regulon positive regulatory protein
VAYKKQQNNKSAEDVLTQALQKAQKGNWKFVFVEAEKDIRHILSSLSPKEYLKDFIYDILDTMPNHLTNQNKTWDKGNVLQKNYIAPLTNREIDVLELMANRLSNKEIAAALFISPGTVKLHTINIFKKLDVHKRREAVLKAQYLGIIKT